MSSDFVRISIETLFITTNECVVVVFSVASGCVSVCLSVCYAVTFETLS